MNFVIGGAILLAILGALMVTTQGAARDTTASDAENLRADAHELVGLLTENEGIGWASGADSLTRIGLRNDNGSGLDSSRIGAMKGAQYDATANGKLDYDEARALLGLDGAVGDFHLRIAPVGLANAAIGGDLSGIRTMYIADFEDPETSIEVVMATEDIMVADARDQLELDMSAAALQERYALAELGLGFDNETTLVDWDVKAGVHPVYDQPLEDVVDPEKLEGDVYPDQKQYLNDRIDAVIDEYEVVVIGANVDHNALTSNAFKEAIDDWVRDGGTLMVFGSDSQSFQWLESLMDVGVETANQGAFAPDVDHPLLREPHQLSWPDYQHFEQGWGGKKGKNNDFDDLFQHIIQDDQGDVLAVSLDGAFGDGRVFLSTFRPADISTKISLEESMNLINNMVVYGDHSHLYLDYGPSPPQDASVGAATRTSYVWDDDFGQVPVRVTVLAWGT